MALTNFSDKVTAITHTWLNKIDVLYVTVFGEATTKAEARTSLGVAQTQNNLLPNVNWQMTSNVTYGTAMGFQGTGTQAACSFTSFTASSNVPTFVTTDTGQLAVGTIVTINSLSNLSVSALRITALVTNTSFTVKLPFDLLSPSSATGNAIPVGVGDVQGNTTGALATLWNKTVALVSWVDDFTTNKCVGAIRVMGLRKTAGTDQVIYHEVSENGRPKYAGRTVTFGALVRQKVQGGAGTWKLQITDGLTTSESSSGTGSAYSHATYSGYEFLSVSHVVSSSLTELTVRVSLNGASADVYYVALPTLVFGANLAVDMCGPMPQEFLNCQHWNPPILTPLAKTFPAAAYTGTGGLLFGYSGTDCDIEALSYGVAHKTVKAIKTKIELDMPVSGQTLFTGSSLTGELLFGPQQYTNGKEGSLSFSTAGNTVADALTRYIGPADLNATEASASVRAPFSGTILSMYAQSDGVSAGTRVYTLMKNGVATAMTGTSTGSGAQASDIVNTVSVTAGDTLSIRLVTSGTGTVVAHRVTLRLSVQAKIACQGWLPLAPDGTFALFGDAANQVITNATFDFDTVQL